MERAFAQRLIELNNRFYRENANSFSRTRQAPWPGWGRALEVAGKHLGHSQGDPDRPLRVFDLACGNLRFEAFLAEQADRPLELHGVDSCDELTFDESGHADAVAGFSYRELDVLGALMDKSRSGEALLADVPAADLSVCFGFMHHVPGAELREDVLRMLLAHTRAGGIAVMSFWAFAENPRLARKAADATARAAKEPPFEGFSPRSLEPGDYLLDWQGTAPYRYCHSFGECEVSRLAEAVSGEADEVGRYSADGRAGNLNRYLILCRR